MTTGVELELTAEDGHDVPPRLTAGLVIVADGAQSRLRELLHVETVDHDYGQSAVVANVTPSRPHQNTAYERFTDSGPLAVMPLDKKRCGVIWSVSRGDSDALLELGDEHFLARLTQRFGHRLGSFDEAWRTDKMCQRV